MKKNILIIISIISFSILLIFIGYIYIVFGYTKGELNDSKRIFDDKKMYILNLSFEGKIQKKTNDILSDKSHRYSIKLILNKFNPKPSIAQRQYPTYYQFINDSTLQVTISQPLFDQIEINHRIKKKSADYFVEVNGKKIQFLSNNKDKWLP